jgi:very-short-patch-repair endonuclease
MSSNSSPPLFITPGLAREVTLQQRAHFMRFHPTPSEALLWSRLRGRRLGVQFRRQVVVGSHIVDFMAPAAGLVVEVDGDGYHSGRVAADRCRDEKLRRAGYAVLRLPASLVERRLADAVALVREALGG